MARVYTEEYRLERDRKRAEWLLGNRDAIAFIQVLTNIAEFWDDVIDRDRQIEPHEADNAFMGALIGLPQNDFYCMHFKMFQPLMISTINAWKDSEVLKAKDDERLRRIAFQLRFMLFEVTKMAAFLIGGWDHLRKVSPDICIFYAYEDFEEWDREEHGSGV